MKARPRSTGDLREEKKHTGWWRRATINGASSSIGAPARNYCGGVFDSPSLPAPQIAILKHHLPLAHQRRYAGSFPPPHTARRGGADPRHERGSLGLAESRGGPGAPPIPADDWTAWCHRCARPLPPPERPPPRCGWRPRAAGAAPAEGPPGTRAPREAQGGGGWWGARGAGLPASATVTNRRPGARRLPLEGAAPPGSGKGGGTWGTGSEPATRRGSPALTPRSPPPTPAQGDLRDVTHNK